MWTSQTMPDWKALFDQDKETARQWIESVRNAEANTPSEKEKEMILDPWQALLWLVENDRLGSDEACERFNERFEKEGWWIDDFQLSLYHR